MNTELIRENTKTTVAITLGFNIELRRDPSNLYGTFECVVAVIDASAATALEEHLWSHWRGDVWLQVVPDSQAERARVVLRYGVPSLAEGLLKARLEWFLPVANALHEGFAVEGTEFLYKWANRPFDYGAS